MYCLFVVYGKLQPWKQPIHSHNRISLIVFGSKFSLVIGRCSVHKHILKFPRFNYSLESSILNQCTTLEGGILRGLVLGEAGAWTQTLLFSQEHLSSSMYRGVWFRTNTIFTSSNSSINSNSNNNSSNNSSGWGGVSWAVLLIRTSTKLRRRYSLKLWTQGVYFFSFFHKIGFPRKLGWVVAIFGEIDLVLDMGLYWSSGRLQLP